jgi:hypothetical protein
MYAAWFKSSVTYKIQMIQHTRKQKAETESKKRKLQEQAEASIARSKYGKELDEFANDFDDYEPTISKSEAESAHVGAAAN